MPTRRTHRLRTVAVALLATAAATVAVVAPALPAQAKPTASDVKKQIADLNNQIETVVEEYNGVHTKLASDLAKSSALDKLIPSAQLQAVFAQQRVGAIAHDIYIAGPTSGLAALLDQGSTTTLLDELGALNAIAKGQRTTINTATAAVTEYQTQMSTLKSLIASEQAQDKQLATKKADILAKLAKLKVLQAQIANASKPVGGGGGGSGGSGGSGGGSTGNHGFARSYVEPVACPQVSSSGKGHTAAVKACSLLWPIHMYGWAQAGPSKYDCSGLTMTAWKAAGVSLQHFTGDQWNESYAISKSQLRPGDLVFYNSRHHVSIYIGNNYIVQAEETGQPVKESPINFEPVVSNGYRRVKGT